ncbi:MAG: LCP family protein [Ruminococcaceae bacterium]|nr:LCP family protein [Oscillospiraceae bacterium]
MERKKGRAFKSFLKGFVITLLVLVPAYIGVFRFATAKAEEKVAPAPRETQEVSAEVTPKNYNMLFLVKEEGTRRLIGASLIRFDTRNTRAVACALPLDTVLLSDKRPVTLKKLYESGGGDKTGECVSDTLGITLSGFVATDENTLAEVVDTLGGFPFLLEKDFSVKNADGVIVYTKYAGSSRLSGNDAAMLLLHAGEVNENGVYLRERLLEAALGEFGRGDFAAGLSEAYSGAVNKIETDISLSGMYALTKAANSIRTESGISVTVARLEGKKEDGRFELSEAACERINELFGTRAAED